MRKTPHTKPVWGMAAVLLAALLCCSCELLPPAPSNEQILEAVMSSNNAQAEPLDLVYEEMQIPHRSPGRVGAVVWVADKRIQRNYVIAYDKETHAFHVASFTTAWLGEDGVYRHRRPEG